MFWIIIQIPPTNAWKSTPFRNFSQLSQTVLLLISFSRIQLVLFLESCPPKPVANILSVLVLFRTSLLRSIKCKFLARFCPKLPPPCEWPISVLVCASKLKRLLRWSCWHPSANPVSSSAAAPDNDRESSSYLVRVSFISLAGQGSVPDLVTKLSSQPCTLVAHVVMTRLATCPRKLTPHRNSLI